MWNELTLQSLLLLQGSGNLPFSQGVASNCLSKHMNSRKESNLAINLLTRIVVNVHAQHKFQFLAKRMTPHEHRTTRLHSNFGHPDINVSSTKTSKMFLQGPTHYSSKTHDTRTHKHARTCTNASTNIHKHTLTHTQTHTLRLDWTVVGLLIARFLRFISWFQLSGEEATACQHKTKKNHHGHEGFGVTGTSKWAASISHS